MNTREIKKLKIRVLFSISCIIILVAGVRLFDYLIHIESDLENKKELVLKQINFIYQNELDEVKESFIARGEYISKYFAKAIKGKDRETLYKLAKPKFDTIKKDYPNFNIMHFHLPDHTALLRVHQPNAYGDYLKDIRPMVTKAIKTQQIQFGLESGLHDMKSTTYRVAIPIINEDDFLGVLELGVNLEYVLNKVKRFYKEVYQKDMEIAFLLKEEYTQHQKSKISYTKFGNYEFIHNDSFFDNILHHLNPQEGIQQLHINQTEYYITWNQVELQNFRREVIGTVIYAFPITTFIMQRNSTILQALIKPIIVLIIMLMLFHFLFNYFTTKIMQSEMELKNILDLQESLVVLTNGEQIINANQTLLNFFGYKDVKTFLKEHQCICNFFQPGESFIQKEVNGLRWNLYISQSPDKIHKVKMKNLQGKEQVFIINISSLKMNKDVTNIVTFTDITNLEKKSTELEIAKVNAELANRTKSEFLANMSHEIRTPMNAILGFISILREKETDQEKIKFLDIINSSSNTLLSIINDILDFSKIESGKLHIDKIDFHPQEEFKGLAKLFLAKAKEKNIRFIVDIDNKLPKILYGDILRIKQITANLLSNAIKFTNEEGSVTLKVYHKDKKLFIRVQDSGIGIKKEKQSQIFEAFSQAENSTTRTYGGTGLGLAICKQLTQLLKGEISVESTYGKGSEFSFWIPVRNGREKHRIEENIQNKVSFNAKILLVEDNRSNQMLMKLFFKKFDLSYEIANDGLEAVELFQKKKFDLILMDENMPNLNGIEATKQILAIEKEKNIKHTPIVALTANAIKGDRELFLAAGMDEYLPKPVNKEALAKVFNKFLS